MFQVTKAAGSFKKLCPEGASQIGPARELQALGEFFFLI